MTRYYVVMSLRLWADVETSCGIELAPCQEGRSVGFLSVYATRDEAEAAADGKRVVEIETKEPKEKN